MAWTEQWSYKIDNGTELNDKTTYVCQVPELDTVFEQEAITVAVDGEYPSFIRMQPREGAYTFIINMSACNWITYRTRITALKAIFTPGLHTFTAQARGMANPLSVPVVVKGMVVDAKIRQVVVSTLAPRPILE